MTKSFRINATVYCVEKIKIPVKINIAILVAGTRLRPLANRLPNDRFPTYVQRMIDRIFRPHRQFSKAYIDDIVIFSSFLNEHVKHLNDVVFFCQKNIHSIGNKSFFGYFSIQLFEQKVYALKLATTEDKFRVISFLFFPKTLTQLEKYLGLIGYLRQYIAHYAAISRPLQVPAPEIIVNNHEESEIEKLLQKKRIRRGKGWSVQYLARWFEYRLEYNQWIFEHRLNNARDFINDYE